MNIFDHPNCSMKVSKGKTSQFTINGYNKILTNINKTYKHTIINFN